MSCCVCGHSVYAHIDGGECMGCLPPGCSFFEDEQQADRPTQLLGREDYDGFYAGKYQL